MIKCQQSSVFIGEEAWVEFERLLESLASFNRKVFILADEHTAEHCVERLQSVHGVVSEHLLVVESGEASKKFEIVYHLWSELLESGADRNSILLNVGGGVITDLGGFVASTFKRGIPFINIPTSLMGMADAATGGKTGIDLGSAKNQVGTFAWPESVLVMPEMLESLPDLETRSGYVECLKHGLLSGNDLFNSLISGAPDQLDSKQLEKIVKVKVDVVNDDPLESGQRKSLNLGHTVGHAIESALLETGSSLPHGHCVLLGLIAELKMAELHFGLDAGVFGQVTNFATNHFSEAKSIDLDMERIRGFMQFDKKNQEGEIRFSLLREIGKCEVDVAVDQEIIQQGLKQLESWLGR